MDASQLMELESIGDVLQIINELPANWKIVFVAVFFLIPKIIQLFGGGRIIHAAISKFFDFNVEVIRRYQARKQREIEDDSYEVYTRTLMIESLGLFSERLKRMDHKVNHMLQILEKEADIEEIEEISPNRDKTDTVVHSRIHERLRKLREELNQN